MKKTVAITILLVLLMSIFQVVYAADPNIEVNFTGGTEITQDAETVTLIISVGAFTEMPEDPTIAYQAVLEYDKTIFSSVSVEGINNWSARYEEPNILGETVTTGVANTEVAKITLTLNENVEAETTTVKLTSGQISVASTSDLEFEFDTTFEKEITINIVEESEPEENQNDTPNENTAGNTTENTVENATKNETNTTSATNNTSNTTGTTTNNTDNTTASNKLPSTGAEKIALIVVLILGTGIGCLIRYKSIKIK